MFISVDVIFGKMALFYCGIIKQINIKGTLVINYSELNNQDQTKGKITIPINEIKNNKLCSINSE